MGKQWLGGAGDGNWEDEDDTFEIADSSSGSTGSCSILNSGGGKLPCSTWGGGATEEVVPQAPRFASQSAISLPMILAWPGTQANENDATRRSWSNAWSSWRMSFLLDLPIHLRSAMLMVNRLSMKKILSVAGRYGTRFSGCKLAKANFLVSWCTLTAFLYLLLD